MFLFQILERIFTGLFRECFCSRSLNEYLLDYLQDVSVLEQGTNIYWTIYGIFLFQIREASRLLFVRKGLPNNKIQIKIIKKV